MRLMAEQGYFDLPTDPAEWKARDFKHFSQADLDHLIRIHPSSKILRQIRNTFKSAVASIRKAEPEKVILKWNIALCEQRLQSLGLDPKLWRRAIKGDRKEGLTVTIPTELKELLGRPSDKLEFNSWGAVKIAALSHCVLEGTQSPALYRELFHLTEVLPEFEGSLRDELSMYEQGRRGRGKKGKRHASTKFIQAFKSRGIGKSYASFIAFCRCDNNVAKLAELIGHRVVFMEELDGADGLEFEIDGCLKKMKRKTIENLLSKKL
ncbi:MAG: hypothetical protein EA369_02140 [Bradymonadales bacterium]|nr:MAG: hypothetical protein EA369_02140 [Bradymonadales bacterium]